MNKISALPRQFSKSLDIHLFSSAQQVHLQAGQATLETQPGTPVQVFHRELPKRNLKKGNRPQQKCRSAPACWVSRWRARHPEQRRVLPLRKKRSSPTPSQAVPGPAGWQKEMTECSWFTTAQPFTAPKTKVVTGIGHPVVLLTQTLSFSHLFWSTGLTQCSKEAQPHQQDIHLELNDPKGLFQPS